MTTVGQVDLRITGDSRDFRRSMSNAERAADRSSARIVGGFSRVDAAATRSARSIGLATSAMVALGAAAATAMGAGAIRTIANFEQAMSTVAGVTGATTSELQALESVAKKLGSSTRFSASQAAEGMLFLARAGFTVDEVLSSIPGTLQLAQAGNLDLGRAADIASNALSGFNLPASDMQRILDVLAVASNKANTDIVQLGEALKFAAPTAVALGISVEETVAVIGKLSDAGIQAGLAGRSFQSLGTQIINQQPAIEALIGKYDLAEEGLAKIVRRLVDAGITTQQISQIFRGENLDAFTVLANTSDGAAGSIQALEQTLKGSQGELAKLAKIMDENLNGAILAAQSALEALILAFGDLGVSSGATSALQGLASLLRTAADNADILAAAAVALTTRALIPLAVTGAVAAGSALTKLRAEADLAVLAMGRLTGAAAIAGRALTVFGGPLTIAITAAAAAFAYLAINSTDAADSIADVEDTLRDISEVEKEIAADTQKLVDLQGDLKEALEAQQTAVADLAGAEISSLRERIAKNRELKEEYIALAAAQLSQARREVDGRTQRRLAERVNANTAFLGTRTPTDPEEQSKRIEQERQRLLAIIQSGGTLDDYDQKLFEDILDFRETQRRVAELEDLLARLEEGKPLTEDNGPTRRGGGGGGGSNDGPTDAEIEAEKRRKERYAQDRAAAEERRKEEKENADLVRREEEARIARGQELLGIVEQRQEMDVANAELAKAQSGTDRQAIVDAQNKVAALRQEEFIRRRIADLIEAGLKPGEAARRAKEDAAALRAAGGFGFVSDDEQDLGFEDLKSRTKRALQEAIETGDWGQAFQDGIRSAASAGLNSAIEDAVDVLFDALKNIDFGGGGIFGSIAKFFGGGRASGGRVYRGAAYTVGELGPETFIPDTDGLIVPNQKVQGIDGAVMGGSQQINITQVLNIPGDPGKETVDLVRQELANTMPSMRRMVRAEVSQGQTRGRF